MSVAGKPPRERPVRIALSLRNLALQKASCSQGRTSIVLDSIHGSNNIMNRMLVIRPSSPSSHGARKNFMKYSYSSKGR